MLKNFPRTSINKNRAMARRAIRSVIMMTKPKNFPDSNNC